MKVSYNSKKLQKQMADATEIKKAFGTMAKRLQQRLDDMEAVDSLAVLRQIPAAQCHQLGGNRTKHWAVMITGNYRLIFTLDHDPVPLLPEGGIDERAVTNVCVMGIEDYH